MLTIQLISHSGQDDQGASLIILQPKTSWRSQIYPQYAIPPQVPYEGKARTIQHEGLEQIDLLWIYMIKHPKIRVVITEPAHACFVTQNKRAMLRMILNGNRLKNIPRLLSSKEISRLGISEASDLQILMRDCALTTGVPLQKLKLNYALNFPVREDIEKYVPDFQKLYNSI